MKRLFIMFMAAAMVFSFAGCNTSTNDVSTQSSSGSESESMSTESTATVTDPSSEISTETDDAASLTDNSEEGENEVSTKKILVAFFSRTGENYGVGVIEKGNTHIIADMIAEEMGADTFEIARVTPYPEAYEECIEEAKQEQNDEARPELTATVDNLEDYDVIFLGYPNWWGDMPMPVYTFLESYDFSGKTVVPFCTHAGSGLSGTVGTLTEKLSDSTVLEGLAIAGTTAQNDQDTAKESVLSWLGGLDLAE